MRARLAFLPVCLALAIGGAQARAASPELSMPGAAVLTREIVEEAGSYRLPVGPFRDGMIRTLRIEGRIVQQAWRIEAQGMTTLQILAPLREQLVAAGFNVLYDCAAPECGGFDFRFDTRVMAAPDMFVDLLDYRFLSARREGADGSGDYASLLVSRSGARGYVQVIHTGDAQINVLQPEPAEAVPMPAPGGAPADQPLDQALLRQGHVIFSDLEFETGSAALGQGPFASLRALAAFLAEDTGRRVALVGHTDSVGGLEPNTELSRARASAVMTRLIETHGVRPDQLEARGVGYLAPIATNRTATGREANRRVEAVLLNTE